MGWSQSSIQKNYQYYKNSIKKNQNTPMANLVLEVLNFTQAAKPKPIKEKIPDQF